LGNSYRFRFLFAHPDDIEKAVFGEGIIKFVAAERMTLFKFQLTLSEEYGVPFNMAFGVVEEFLVRTLIDDSVLPETVETIFAEILSVFPTNEGKSVLGKMFLRETIQRIRSIRGKFMGSQVQKKISLLWALAEIHKADKNLWTP